MDERDTRTRVQRNFRIWPEVAALIDGHAQRTGQTKDAALEAMVRQAARAFAKGVATDMPDSPVETSSPSEAAEVSSPDSPSQRGENPPSLEGLTDELKTATTHHETWLRAHQKTLSDTYDTVSKVVTDLAGFGTRAEEVKTALDDLTDAQKKNAKDLGDTLQTELGKINTGVAAELRTAGEYVSKSKTALADFKTLYDEQIQSTGKVIERFKKAMKLTPLVSAGICAVLVVLGVLVAVVFKPTFEQFHSNKLVHETLAPVIKAEVQEAFAQMKAGSDAQAKEFFQLEHERFAAFAKHYKTQISQLNKSEAQMLGDLEFALDERRKWEQETTRLQNLLNAQSVWGSMGFWKLAACLAGIFALGAVLGILVWRHFKG